MKELTVLEQIILSVILNLKGEAYGVSVRQRVNKMIEKKLNYGTLYNALEQLLRKDLVEKTQGEPTPDRIGRPRIYYTLTPAGKRALRKAYELQKTIWENIPDIVEGRKL
ncbi:PadR family transcriptional regulator [Acidobacteriota bacterium]